MPQQKRNRQWVSTRAKAAAAEAARRRRRRQRVSAAVAVGVLVIALFGAAALVLGGNGKKTTVTTPSSNGSTTSLQLLSVAGQPCVPVADALPPGAPNVPVQVGPPPTALVSQDIKVGDGPEVQPGATVTVNYIGVACSTGKIFDASWKRGQTYQANLAGGVIPGWQQGIPGMKVGGERLLGIPPDLAYGETGNAGISPGETLWFVVDVVSVP